MNAKTTEPQGWGAGRWHSCAPTDHGESGWRSWVLFLSDVTAYDNAVAGVRSAWGHLAWVDSDVGGREAGQRAVTVSQEAAAHACGLQAQHFPPHVRLAGALLPARVMDQEVPGKEVQSWEGLPWHGAPGLALSAAFNHSIRSQPGLRCWPPGRRSGSTRAVSSLHGVLSPL